MTNRIFFYVPINLWQIRSWLYWINCKCFHVKLQLLHPGNFTHTHKRVQCYFTHWNHVYSKATIKCKIIDCRHTCNRRNLNGTNEVALTQYLWGTYVPATPTTVAHSKVKSHSISTSIAFHPVLLNLFVPYVTPLNVMSAHVTVMSAHVYCSVSYVYTTPKL